MIFDRPAGRNVLPGLVEGHDYKTIDDQVVLSEDLRRRVRAIPPFPRGRPAIPDSILATILGLFDLGFTSEGIRRVLATDYDVVRTVGTIGKYRRRAEQRRDELEELDAYQDLTTEKKAPKMNNETERLVLEYTVEMLNLIDQMVAASLKNIERINNPERPTHGDA